MGSSPIDRTIEKQAVARKERAAVFLRFLYFFRCVCYYANRIINGSVRLYDAVGEGKKSVGRGGGGMRALRGLLTGLSARNLEACADGASL